jgi:hypothetical protein
MLQAGSLELSINISTVGGPWHAKLDSAAVNYLFIQDLTY